MSKFLLRKTSATTYRIQASRTKIGSAHKRGDEWVVLTTHHGRSFKVKGPNLSQAFSDICLEMNNATAQRAGYEDLADQITKENAVVRIRVDTLGFGRIVRGPKMRVR